jgi:antitoxin VapB
MSLHIKDPEAQRLARAISLVTGESMTQVVIEALRDRYLTIERQKREAEVDERLSVSDQAAGCMKPPHIKHADPLYDENGVRTTSAPPLSPAALLLEVRQLGLQTPGEASCIVRTDRDRRWK